MSDSINRKIHKWRVGTECICPTACDCEDFEKGLVSNECPVHNDNPHFVEGCPVHDDGDDIPDYCSDFLVLWQVLVFDKKLLARCQQLEDTWATAELFDGSEWLTANDKELPMALALVSIKVIDRTGSGTGVGEGEDAANNVG